MIRSQKYTKMEIVAGLLLTVVGASLLGIIIFSAIHIMDNPKEKKKVSQEDTSTEEGNDFVIMFYNKKNKKDRIEIWASDKARAINKFRCDTGLPVNNIISVTIRF